MKRQSAVSPLSSHLCVIPSKIVKAFVDGKGVVISGKVICCERKEESGPGGKKK